MSAPKEPNEIFIEGKKIQHGCIIPIRTENVGFKTDIKYLSEYHVKELLAEKDKEIDLLKSQVPEWISVEDNFPNDENIVLSIPYYNKVWYAKDWSKWCHNGSRDIVKYEITHWMPLPKQP